MKADTSNAIKREIDGLCGEIDALNVSIDNKYIRLRTWFKRLHKAEGTIVQYGRLYDKHS